MIRLGLNDGNGYFVTLYYVRVREQTRIQGMYNGHGDGNTGRLNTGGGGSFGSSINFKNTEHADY
jgi:hypothetical protein